MPAGRGSSVVAAAEGFLAVVEGLLVARGLGMVAGEVLRERVIFGDGGCGSGVGLCCLVQHASRTTMREALSIKLNFL